MHLDRPKILIVDDIRANLVALRAILAKVDASVITASSGNEALARTLDHDFALILLDVNMPDMSGYDVAEILRDEDRTRSVPIIFVTAAYKDDAHRMLAYGAGAVDYIEKPIDEVVLVSKIRVFLELDRTRRELAHTAWQLAEQNHRLESEVIRHQATVAALRDSEERFRLAVSGTNDGIWDHDLASGHCYYSPRWMEMLGLGEAEVSDSRDEWRRRVHPDDLTQALADLNHHLSGRTPVYENVHRLRHRDGVHRWVLDRGRVVRDGLGRPVRIVGAITDISDLRGHELRIRTLNERLAHILTSVADGIYGIDTAGRITFANAAMERLSGWSGDGLIGQSADALLHRRTEADGEDGGILQAILRHGESRIVRVETLWRKDGTEIPVEYTAAALASADRVDGAVVVVRDATDRARYERGLEQARLAAEEASHAKSAFLAVMSHELRTPLNTILGFSEIIRDASFGPICGERYQEYATDIFVAGTHLLDLINDILDLSKIEAGRMEIEPRWLDLRHALASVTRFVREKALRQGVEVVVELEPGLPLLWADERAFKQMVLNLLSNALKFTPQGGRITIRGARQHDGGLAVTVADTGPGIPPDKIGRVFKPFEQVDNRYNRSVAGTGLGLSLTKGLVEIHQGTVTLESVVDVGTTVTVRLPPGPTEPPTPG